MLVAQSCPTLCDPRDCSPLVSSVHGIFQARILEWVAISSSRGSSQRLNPRLLYLLHWQAGSLPNLHYSGISLIVKWLRLCTPNAGGQGPTPGQGTRSHRLQWRAHALQLKIPHATTKTWFCQINEYLKNKFSVSKPTIFTVPTTIPLRRLE